MAAYLASQTEVIGEMKFTIVDVEERGRSVMMRMKRDVEGAGSGVVLPVELNQRIPQHSEIARTVDQAEDVEVPSLIS